MITSEQLQTGSETFLGAQSPVVILAARGCHEIAVNQVFVDFEHSLSSHACSHQVIRDKQEYFRVVQEAWMRLPQLDEDDRNLLHKAVRCFCEKVKSLIALRFKDCPYESQLDAFLSNPQRSHEKVLLFC